VATEAKGAANGVATGAAKGAANGVATGAVSGASGVEVYGKAGRTWLARRGVVEAGVVSN